MSAEGIQSGDINKSNEFEILNRKIHSSSVISLNDSLNNSHKDMKSINDGKGQVNIPGPNNQISTYNATLDVKEMPLNPFDFIWYANKLNPNFKDENGESVLKMLQNSENMQSGSNNAQNWSFGSANQMIYDELINGSNIEFSAMPVKLGKKNKKNKTKDKEKKVKKAKKSKKDSENNFT